ncbi:MAG: carbohydrate-binding domain-containing protein [Treponema sp.]|jgi:hypothetical protein|nr:carbohydrate-binding domain-containing protein [Treponema sp.]
MKKILKMFSAAVVMAAFAVVFAACDTGANPVVLETQTTTTAALAQNIQPHNSPPTTYETIDLSTLSIGNAQSGNGWNFSAAGVLEITNSGAFRVVGGSAPALFEIFILANVNADIIIDNTNITTMDITDGGNQNVRLWLEGSNSISATGVPGIQMGATPPPSLEINGPGSLNVIATPGSGIFGGSLTLNSGTLTVSGGTNGITSNPLTVNGGSLTVTGGTNGITSPNLNINGGSVNSSTITTPPTNVNITGDPSITITGGNPLLWFYPLPQNITVTEGSITEALTANAHTSQLPPSQLNFTWVQTGVGNVGTDSNTLAIPTGLTPGQHTFTVTATGLNNVTLTHTFTVTVDPAAADIAITGVGISGTPQVGNTLTAAPAPANSHPAPVFSWYRVDTDGNETHIGDGITFTLTDAELGYNIILRASQDDGASGTRDFGTQIGPVTEAPPPPVSAAPVTSITFASITSHAPAAAIRGPNISGYVSVPFTVTDVPPGANIRWIFQGSEVPPTATTNNGNTLNLNRTFHDGTPLAAGNHHITVIGTIGGRSFSRVIAINVR